MPRVPIIRVNDMTRRAAGRTIIARVIVCARIVKCRIEQTRLLQTQIHRVGTLRGPESARTQTLVRLAWIFIFVRQTNFQASFAAALEHPQNIARLRYFPTRQRIQERQNPLQSFLLISWLRNLNQPLRRAGLAIAFTEVGVLDRETAVVVKRGAPKHRAMGHHAFRDAVRLSAMTIRTAACFPGDAQITGIDETNELETFFLKQWPRRCRNPKLSLVHPLARITRTHVRRVLFRRCGIAAVTGGAGQPESVFAVIEFVERRRRTKLVHWFDLVVTLQAAFECFGWRAIWEISAV